MTAGRPAAAPAEARAGALGEVVQSSGQRVGELCREVAALPPVGAGTDRWEADHRREVLRRLRLWVMPREVAAVRVLGPLARRHLVDGRHWVRTYIDVKKKAEVSLIKMAWLDEKDPAHNDLTARLCEQLGACVILEGQLLSGLDGRLEPGEDAEGARRFERIRASRWTGTRPHPDLPAGSLVSRALTPLVATVDRLRDRLDPPKVGT